MERRSLVFTVFFMLLGPIKVIGGFGRLMQAADRSFTRDVAIKGALVASAIVACAALLGGTLVANYDLSLPALQLAGGLVLLISALRVMFPGVEPPGDQSSKPTALQLAIAPVAMPIVVTPAGIAAILILVTMAPRFPGMGMVIAAALATMMVLDFVVMFYIDVIVSMPGLFLVLQVFGAVLIFIQAALAIDTLVDGLKGLGTLP